MIFPLGPKNNFEKEEYIQRDRDKADKDGKEYVEVEYVTDVDIKEMLEDLKCKVKRIVHRETARDVYYWTADNTTQDKALDKAYKLKGSYAPDKSVNLNLNGDIQSTQELEQLADQLNGITRNNN